jgi:cyclopropane-fatty-acyl-phospholipid synthase
LPDWTIRWGIRRLLGQRLRSLSGDGANRAKVAALKELGSDELAIETQAANDQHYEVSAEFFQKVLGRHLKYSCGFFEQADSTLDQAEAAMLGLTCEHANLQDGQQILELGCGWGSLTIWMAERYPNAQITALSNSLSQRQYIERQLMERKLENVRVLTCDLRQFQTTNRFDRIVSVEMFEHVRNYRELLRRIAGWLVDDGQLFVHIFCHQNWPYLFETEGAANWMGRHFFTGGTMPCLDLFSHFSEDLVVRDHWPVSGLHYWKTCEAWLSRLDQQRESIHQMFSQIYGPSQGPVMLQRWRMFMLACAELFRYRDGQEWLVCHYRLERSPACQSGPAKLKAKSAERLIAN